MRRRPPWRTRLLAAGFSLIEMLVVLVIMSLLAGVAMLTGAGRSHAELISSAREVAGLLRETRARAGNANRPQRVVADVGLNRVWADTTETASHVVAVPRALRISLITIDAEALSSGRGAILFFPDGSSTGGGVRLEPARRQGETIIVSVDWLTGQVAIEDGGTRRSGMGKAR
jgi:general secretion pathway protein H